MRAVGNPLLIRAVAHMIAAAGRAEGMPAEMRGPPPPPEPRGDESRQVRRARDRKLRKRKEKTR